MLQQRGPVEREGDAGRGGREIGEPGGAEREGGIGGAQREQAVRARARSAASAASSRTRPAAGEQGSDGQAFGHAGAGDAADPDSEQQQGADGKAAALRPRRRRAGSAGAWRR